MRLKVQRNAVQDVTLLNAIAKNGADLNKARSEVANRFNRTTVEEWWAPRPALADTDPLEWSNATIGDALPQSPKFTEIDAGAWRRVRGYVLERAREVR
jgi:hypothetical protein